MRTIAILILLSLPQPAIAGPAASAVKAACRGPVARAIALAQRPTIHPVAKVQPEEAECADGDCPADVAKPKTKVVEPRRLFGRWR